MDQDVLGELRALYEARRLDEAWVLYLSTPMAAAEWHLYGALVAWRRSDPRRGKEIAELALHSHPWGELRIRCLFASGICHREYGELGVATERFNQCLALLPRHPDQLPLYRGTCLYNRGLAQGSCGLLPESLQSYEDALREFRSERMQDFERQCLQNLAWVAAEIGQFPRSQVALDEAEPLCDTQRARLVQKMTAAYLHGQMREPKRTLALCAEIEQTDGCPADVRSLALSIAAEAGLQLGLIEHAGIAANHAVEFSKQAPRDHRCHVRAYKVLGDVQRAKQGLGA